MYVKSSIGSVVKSTMEYCGNSSGCGECVRYSMLKVASVKKVADVS